VFAVILSEPAGSTTVTSYNSAASISEVRYQGNFVHTQTRRFVVVRTRREFCFACPIFTYSNRATLKRGVRPEEHGIAYSDGEQPQLVPGEAGIRKPSVAVAMAAGEPSLHIASRIYYGIHHPIQYNVKVKDIGQVLEHHIVHLIGNWMAEDISDTKQSADVTATADEPELMSVLEEPDEDGEQSNSISGKAGKAPRHAPPSPSSHKDPHLYDPEGNVYGYDDEVAPHMYHPKHNPHGFHPENNKHGFHPSSNAYSYHPEHNPHGHHPQEAPYCYHPVYSPYGYHAHDNVNGYHPHTAPYNYHPKANPHGFHPEHNKSGYHPDHDPYRFHPTYNIQGYHKDHNKLAYHPTINEHAFHEQYNPRGYHPKLNKKAYHPKRNPNGKRYPKVVPTQDTSSIDQSFAGAAEGSVGQASNAYGENSAYGQSSASVSNSHGDDGGEAEGESLDDDDAGEGGEQYTGFEGGEQYTGFEGEH
jgi:hypothetical protein